MSHFWIGVEKIKSRIFKRICPVVFYGVVFAGLALTSGATRYMENLGRGVVAVRTSTTQVYVGWRMLGTEWGKNIGYHIYRDGVRITSSPITSSTNYIDATTVNGVYNVSPVIDGVEGIASSPAVSVWGTNYLTIPLQVPAGVTTPDGVTCTYSPNDCSVGDLDGDGEYEIVLKWDPSNSQDNSISGYTGNVYLDAYEMDGTPMWRINLGRNIRAGAHYTQFIVYDLDSDGKAEVACRTAPYTIDGQGNYVLLSGDTLTDYRNTSGYILTGPEYLTIFNGQTGAAMVSTDFYPDRVNVSQWGDSYGNRVDRFLAGVAYVDGQKPSLIMARGYYGPQSGYSSRNEITAWNWRCGTLTRLWWFKAGLNINNNINSSYISQGCHSLSIADVDGDGKDETVYGACAIDHNGSPLYNTGLGHGDALHVGDFDPDRPGLEVWQCHEGGSGSTFRDAATGAIIFQFTSTGDVGRACADDIYAGNRGGEMWANTSGLRDRYGNYVGRAPSSTNFLVWWDGDVVRELLDSNRIDKYGLSSDTRLLTASGCSSNNGTKSTPCLSGDILGDWREEVILRTSDNTALRIYTATAITSTRLYTLMHDCQYREAIAWQNGAYNQPPHPSFYLGDGTASLPTPDIKLAKVPTGDITGDGIVDTADLVQFARSWLKTDYEMLPELNLNGDCSLDYRDFVIFSGNWLSGL
jgi:rhamnogalacturonan endolyase